MMLLVHDLFGYGFVRFGFLSDVKTDSIGEMGWTLQNPPCKRQTIAASPPAHAADSVGSMRYTIMTHTSWMHSIRWRWEHK